MLESGAARAVVVIPSMIIDVSAGGSSAVLWWVWCVWAFVIVLAPCNMPIELPTPDLRQATELDAYFSLINPR